MPSKPAKIVKLQLTRETIATLRLRTGLRTGQAGGNPPPPDPKSADGCMGGGTAVPVSLEGICERVKAVPRVPVPPVDFRQLP